MKQPRSRIATLLAERTLREGTSPRLMKKVAAYLLSEHRVGELASILRDVQADWAKSGYVEVLATTAHPLGVRARQEIKQQMRGLYPQAKQIVVSEVLDPTTIGGVTLHVADKQFDVSVRSKLHMFQQAALSKQEGIR